MEILHISDTLIQSDSFFASVKFTPGQSTAFFVLYVSSVSLHKLKREEFLQTASCLYFLIVFVLCYVRTSLSINITLASS